MRNRLAATVGLGGAGLALLSIFHLAGSNAPFSLAPIGIVLLVLVTKTSSGHWFPNLAPVECEDIHSKPAEPRTNGR